MLLFGVYAGAIIYFFPKLRKLRRSSAHWCRRRARFKTRFRRRFQRKFREALVQSQVRFNKVPAKVPEKVPGGFGAEPGRVQQGSGERSG